MEQGVVMSGNWLALSGWVACVITIVLQVAYYNRFFGHGNEATIGVRRIELQTEDVTSGLRKDSFFIFLQ